MKNPNTLKKHCYYINDVIVALITHWSNTIVCIKKYKCNKFDVVVDSVVGNNRVLYIH
jgi:hypothetical protein